MTARARALIKPEQDQSGWWRIRRADGSLWGWYSTEAFAQEVIDRQSPNKRDDPT